MTDPEAPFDEAEYRARLVALQTRMARGGLDAMLLTSAPDLFWIAGFLTRFWESPARPWFVLVPASGDPVAVIPAIGAPLMARTWLRDIRSWDAPDPRDDGVGLLADAVTGCVPPGGTLGLPMGAETALRMPLADFETLRSRIAPRRVVDATDALHRTREIKTEAEIAAITRTCAIAARAFARVPEIAGAGVPLDAVFRDFQRLLLEEGADWVAYLAGGAGPGGYDDVISPATGRPLARGDVLMLDTGAVRAGHFCDFDRNWSVGPVNDPARRAQDALWHATEAALQALRPGMRACDLHALLCDALRARGGDPLGGRLGHGLGLSLTEWPSISARDTTPLRAGMVLTLEPGVALAEGRIMVHEENIVLRDSGAALLSPRAPETLPELA